MTEDRNRTGMADFSPDVSLIIVNYNGIGYLEDCFASIGKTSYPVEHMETIMVDNASTDGSIEYVQERCPWVRVLALDGNYGFAGANNIGAEQAGGEYIVFLNNDTVVDHTWLSPLVDVMEENKDVGIAGSKILFYGKSGKINSAGGCIVFTGGGFDIGFGDSDTDVYNRSGARGCVCGAAMIVRREEFLRLGGFDEDYFMYFEDVDLCWRYWLFGKRVEYVPASVVYHAFGGTAGTRRHAPLRVFYGTRNALFNIIKNYEAHNLAAALPLSVIFHILKTLYFIVRLDAASAVSMVKAYGSALKYLPGIIQKRKDLQSRRKVTDTFLFRNSIISSLRMTFMEFLRLLKA